MNAQTILLGEDDEDDVQIFREVLQDLDHKAAVRVAANGLEVLRLLDISDPLPQLVFLDLNMPVKNGLQCLREIRLRPEWKDLRVVMLSTSSHPGQIEAARAAGADGYCVKPGSYTEYKALLQTWLQAF